MTRFTFFILAISLYILLDYYVFQAVKVVTETTAPSYSKFIYAVYWSVTFLSLIALVSFNMLDSVKHGAYRSFLMTAVVINFSAKFFSLLFIVTDDLRRAGLWIYQHFSQSNDLTKETSEGITRSQFLSKSALIAGAVPLSVFSFGMLSGAYDYRVRRRTIYLPNLPSAFDGVRLAQLSDIHSGSFYNKTAVQGGVDLLLAEKPDVIFFTGDLVNNHSSELKDYFPIFEQIKAPLGVFSVLGNHDYGDYASWNSAQAKKQNLIHLINAHKSMGWDILLNENRYLETSGEKIGIIGVENWGARGFTKYGKLDEAYGNIEADTKILMSHDPSHWDAEIRSKYSDIDLTLSGHTHGFQFGVEIGNFRWSPSQWIYKQWADLYQENNQYLYVNRGFGFLGYPGRVGILPEITVLELKKA